MYFSLYTFTNQTTVGSVPSVLLTNITLSPSCMQRLITFALSCGQIATGCVTIQSPRQVTVTSCEEKWFGYAQDHVITLDEPIR